MREKREEVNRQILRDEEEKAKVQRVGAALREAGVLVWAHTAAHCRGIFFSTGWVGTFPSRNRVAADHGVQVHAPVWRTPFVRLCIGLFIALVFCLTGVGAVVRAPVED